ncbi:DUF4188 domain-containing protein [Luteococcus sp. Sow4_B9]|uniref:DUF4188 domain-containing protein n=1 Tax=Luteococcus sp. Sow4_B9 TaxID=3438792 RepID=UPI003F9B13E2
MNMQRTVQSDPPRRTRTIQSTHPMTHAHRGPLVVFNIGMTIHKPHRPDLWLPVARAMLPMLEELRQARAGAAAGPGADPGFLGATTLMGSRGPWVTQYWKDVESLYRYAHDAERSHLSAWRRFNQAVRRHPAAVGVWHETFVVPEAGVESVYVHGAREGLALAGGVIPVEHRGRSAAERMGQATSHGEKVAVQVP